MYKAKVDERFPLTGNWTEDKDLNPCIVETAGFEPLEVKIKRFEQAGIKARFSEDQFTSHDMRDMYLTPDCEVYPSDDLETVTEKLEMQNQIRMKILSEKSSKLEDERTQHSEVSESKSSIDGSERSSDKSE